MFVQEFQPDLMTDISILRNILLNVVVRKIDAAAKHRKCMEGFFFSFHFHEYRLFFNYNIIELNVE